MPVAVTLDSTEKYDDFKKTQLAMEDDGPGSAITPLSSFFSLLKE